jgi:hypothetical protein
MSFDVSLALFWADVARAVTSASERRRAAPAALVKATRRVVMS